jgi:hypothetical protein
MLPPRVDPLVVNFYLLKLSAAVLVAYLEGGFVIGRRRSFVAFAEHYIIIVGSSG